MKQSVGTFTHRYSVVHGQTHSEVQKYKHSSEKLVDIRKLSQMTGFSEEQILESMEFGDFSHTEHGPSIRKQSVYIEV
ncbi:MAG: hypothetical protein WCF60_03280 [Anaerobacillus sp.]